MDSHGGVPQQASGSRANKAEQAGGALPSMLVYVVQDVYMDGSSEIRGVFTTPELARAYIQRNDADITGESRRWLQVFSLDHPEVWGSYDLNTDHVTMHQE